MQLLKNTDFESAARDIGLTPQLDTAVWLKTRLTFGSPIPNYAVAQLCMREIVVFCVTPAGEIEIASAIIIPVISDSNVKVERVFGGHRLSFVSDEGEGSLIIRKFMIGAGWHKKCLANVLNRFENAS